MRQTILLLASSEDWLACALPTGFEWCLPAGKINPVVGEAKSINRTEFYDAPKFLPMIDSLSTYSFAR